MTDTSVARKTLTKHAVDVTGVVSKEDTTESGESTHHVCLEGDRRLNASHIGGAMKASKTAASDKTSQRPWTAGGQGVHSWRDEQNKQDQSMRRLDGMLIEHMERERDILRRITTTVSKP